MQATARMACIVSSTPPARRRLIRDVRSLLPDSMKPRPNSVEKRVSGASIHEKGANGAEGPGNGRFHAGTLWLRGHSDRSFENGGQFLRQMRSFLRKMSLFLRMKVAGAVQEGWGPSLSWRLGALA
jgi:hypothetical protein